MKELEKLNAARDYRAAFKAAYDAAYRIHKSSNDVACNDYYNVAYNAAYYTYDCNKNSIRDVRCIAACIAASFRHSLYAVNKLKETLQDELKELKAAREAAFDACNAAKDITAAAYHQYHYVDTDCWHTYNSARDTSDALWHAYVAADKAYEEAKEREIK